MNNISIVLVRPNISGNLGAVARTMANFGFYDLILIDSKCEIDNEARNRAKHAQKILDDVKKFKNISSVTKAHSLCIATTGVLGSDYNVPRSPLLPEDLAKKLSLTNGKIALIFGPEDSGLSNEELELCDITLTIPTDSKYPVMNLSHAVSIVLYELSKQTHSNNIKKNYPLVDGKEKEALNRALDLAIESVDYRTPFEMRTQKLVWKKIIGKSTPTRREAFAMIGLLKKLAEKKEIKPNQKIKKKTKENKKT